MIRSECVETCSSNENEKNLPEPMSAVIQIDTTPANSSSKEMPRSLNIYRVIDGR